MDTPRPSTPRASVRSRIGRGWIDAYTTSRRRGHGVRASFLGRARRWAVSWFDPIVTIELPGGRELRAPFSHDLPFILADHPGYSDNLRRVLWCLADRRGGLEVVDVGANVGDSILMAHRDDIRFVAIEGLEGFYDHLVVNTDALRGVRTVRATVGRAGERLHYEVRAGTAGTVGGGEGPGDRARTIPEILNELRVDSHVDVVKIDTDGHDAGVILGSWDWITEHRPVLFFEYDPQLHEDDETTLLELVERLAEVGYRWGLVYDETGELVMGAEVASSMADLDRYLRLKASGYWDVCLVADHDDFLALHHAEMEAADTMIGALA